MPEFKSALVLDFDGTMANTFEPSPSGVGVHEAYHHAVLTTLGDGALAHYCKSGGLRNRAPREVVEELFDAGFGTGLDLTTATEHLVTSKIQCLLTRAFGQLCVDGAPWPRLTNGFGAFWRMVKERQEIATVILSSGHEDCIVRTFEMHNLPVPDLIVSDDDLRALPEPLCKPDPRLWQYMLGKSKFTFVNAVYVGDDVVKDGELAANSGVQFFHFAPEGTPRHGHEGTFADWREFPFLFLESL